MSQFVDLTGTKHELSLTIGKARAIKDRLGIDLLAVGDIKQSALVKLADDPDAMCAVLWALVNPDWPATVGDEAAFWNAIDDRTLEQATAALTEALLAFFRPSKRAIVRAAFDLQEKTETALAERLTAMASDAGAVGTAADSLAGTVRASLQTLGS